jgi:glycosyltransferase involved in cell wall biosynthesis
MTLRICLDARLVNGEYGGVQQVIIGLASGLSKLEDGEEEYLFLTNAGSDTWIRPYVYGPCKILPCPASLPQKGKQLLKKVLPANLVKLIRTFYMVGSNHQGPSPSDGTIERAAVDIMHFTMQKGFLTKVPSIYQPHDLQHLHLPQFFSRWERSRRELFYRTLCNQARMVVVDSRWGKDDIIKHYALEESKVKIVLLGPPLSAYKALSPKDLAVLEKKYSLPKDFLFFPAYSWKHKNHIALLEALALVRDGQGLKIPLVLSGGKNDYFAKIEKRVRELHLGGQVRFLGFVPPPDLQFLYKSCRGMIFPTLFEGFGLPIIEAFLEGVPVACSNVTCLPEMVGDAAITFDPTCTKEIANALYRLWNDEALRKSLAELGRKRAEEFTWGRTARLFRAHYRRLAQRPMNEEDRELLAAPPLM